MFPPSKQKLTVVRSPANSTAQHDRAKGTYWMHGTPRVWFRAVGVRIKSKVKPSFVLALTFARYKLVTYLPPRSTPHTFSRAPPHTNQSLLPTHQSTLLQSEEEDKDVFFHSLRQPPRAAALLCSFHCSRASASSLSLSSSALFVLLSLLTDESSTRTTSPRLTAQELPHDERTTSPSATTRSHAHPHARTCTCLHNSENGDDCISAKHAQHSNRLDWTAMTNSNNVDAPDDDEPNTRLSDRLERR